MSRLKIQVLLDGEKITGDLRTLAVRIRDLLKEMEIKHGLPEGSILTTVEAPLAMGGNAPMEVIITDTCGVVCRSYEADNHGIQVLVAGALAPLGIAGRIRVENLRYLNDCSLSDLAKGLESTLQFREYLAAKSA